MGTQRRGREIDPALREKVDHILQEVETAQYRAVGPEEVLHQISYYLYEDPAVAIPVIDGLAATPSPQTARLLEEMIAALQDKRAVKAIKRALYRFRQQGIRWEHKTAGEQPILRPLQPGPPAGYVSAPDAAGSRIVLIARPRPRGGVQASFCIVSDQEGIQRLESTDLSKKGLREFVDASLSSEEFPVVEAPGGYGVHLLREAADLTHRRGKQLPPGYGDVERGLRDVTWDGPVPFINQYIPEESVQGQPRLLTESGELHKTMPFSVWFLSPHEVRPYAEAIKEAEESHIVLTPQQKDERLGSVYREALQGLFLEETRLLWKRRLEEAAYIVWKQGKRHEARLAVSAALDLTRPLSSLDPNPFCWALLFKSLSGLLETGRDEEDKKRAASLIVTP
jgi:hypothetical protein